MGQRPFPQHNLAVAGSEMGRDLWFDAALGILTTSMPNPNNLLHHATSPKANDICQRSRFYREADVGAR